MLRRAISRLLAILSFPPGRKQVVKPYYEYPDGRHGHEGEVKRTYPHHR